MCCINEPDYIEKRLNAQINWYDTKSQNHQKWYKRLKVSMILTTAVIPVFASIKVDFFPIISSSAAGIILICEALISLSKHRDNWVDYRRTTELLKHEKFMYLTRTGVYKNEEDAFALMVERCETIISSENINWANLQTDTEKRKEIHHDK